MGSQIITIRQNVGIDVSKLTFIASMCSQNEEGVFNFGTPTTFSNNKTGFNQFVKWTMKQAVNDFPISFTMEATGVYHEALAIHLHKLGYRVSIVLPNKMKYYAKSLNVKTKTDGVDARIIARMGVEQHLISWIPPKLVYQELRSLTRYLQDLKGQRLNIINHLEAIVHSEFCADFVEKSYKKTLHTIELQITQCEKQIQKTIYKDEQLAGKVDKLLTITGVSLITIAIVVSETHGFDLFSSRKQLASYAGLDVVERQSGTTVHGKSHISRKGNSRIRNALYFPAIVASRHNKPLNEDYLRIIQNKPYKKIGIIALQRKLLLLIFTLWKNNQTFNPDISLKKQTA